MLRWGLIPSWSKDAMRAVSCINARGETVATSPAFRSAFKSRRCIVPADGYYEWIATEDGKQPFYITINEPFAFAGLWEAWEVPKAEGKFEAGRMVETFSIVTTEAGEGTKAVHDREPVMLLADEFEKWLEPSTAPDALQGMIRSIPRQLVQVRPVSRAVNNARNDGPECVKELTV